ncbi:rubredoxin reductase [Gordonia araii NBRC 100433]|uniref:Rubredoxin reductase n=1 Tax=Gordonia araii NBRC 100433 TaxID=1073574 RepID=G7H1Q9_9ACTN|nr:FAD-dependent oxidoreductase [Gordonia araii]NNG99224.1 FAD-dependent oxidoreductase [Gordonia araii NBRC 100433]GAB09784.1 rubredoxin reductase [Gordonia araii NBRC 100433]
MTAVPGAVIVGSGIAGITAAESLRSAGYTAPVTVIGDEEHLPYRRTALSKDLLAADLSDEKIRLRKPEFWAERDIEIVTGTTVDDVDTGTREVVCADGRRFAYESLVLATGGRPRGVAAVDDEVATLRRPADARLLQERIPGRPVVVVGGGLIGLEIAASAAASAESVIVLECAPTVLGRVLPSQIATLLAELHRANRVTIATGVDVTEVTPATVTTADGHVYQGTVISAIGMVPNTGLAEAAGAAVGPAGILVDAELRTTVPGVYAAGDVAARPHPRTGEPARAEQWMTATEHGKVVAATIAADAGLDAPDTSAVSRIPLAWTVHYGRNVQIVGWPGTADRILVDGELAKFDATVRCFAGDDLVGAVCLGRPAAGRAMRTEIEQAQTERVGA